MEPLRLTALFLLVTVAAAALPPQSADQARPYFVVISARFDIGREPRERSPHDLTSPYNDGPPGQYKVTVRVRNASAQAVKSVRWGAVVQDMNKQEDVKRASFTYKKKIGPGAEATLTGYMLPPLRAGALTPKAVVERVEYADGTAWEGRYVHEPRPKPGVIDVRGLPAGP